ncbi:hypothetical protein JF110_001668 [Campylobacter jejuni]|nr:hypothetical protein [Campylobacter jejuni]
MMFKIIIKERTKRNEKLKAAEKALKALHTICIDLERQASKLIAAAKNIPNSKDYKNTFFVQESQKIHKIILEFNNDIDGDLEHFARGDF